MNPEADDRDRMRLAVFRVAFGTVMLADVLHLYAHQGLFPTGDWPFVLPPAVVTFALLVWSIVLVALILGWRTRLAAALNYLFSVAMLGTTPPYSQVAADSVAISLGLFALILPCGDALSLDRRSGRATLRPVGLTRLALPAYLSLVYFDSGLRKLTTPMWLSGLGVVAPAGLPNLVWTDTSWMEWLPAGLLRVAGWGVIVFELAFPLLCLFRSGRVIALVAGVSMHVGIAIIYPIPVFSGLMIAAYAGLLPDRVVGRLVARQGSGDALPVGRWRRLRDAILVAFAGLTLVGWAQAAAPRTSAYLGWPVVRMLTFTLTGITGHGVFGDGLFSEYRYQVRLVPDDGPPIPYSRGNLFRWSVRDKVWEDWWKRAQAPWTSIEYAERRLAMWARFSTKGGCRIEGRPQSVATGEMRPGLFRDNNAIPWRPLGRVVWDSAPRDGEVRLGDYLNRVLHDAR